MIDEARGVLKDALAKVEADGSFPPGAGAEARRALDELLSQGWVPDHPGELLGPWEELPAPARAALKALAEAEIRRVMDFHPRGRLWPGAARGLYVAGKFLRARNRLPRLAGGFEWWSARLWKAPSNLRERLEEHLQRRAWKAGRTLTVGGLLAAVGRRPRWLLGDYLEAVEVDPRARGFFYDPARNVAWGHLIGIDLIPAPDGVWCVEANPNTAAYQDKYRHLWDALPGIERIFEAAREWGFSTVWWHGMDLSEVSPWLMASLRDAAAGVGLEVIVREDYRVPPRPGFPPGLPRPEKRLTSPLEPPDDTLVIRRNNYGVGTDYVLANKEPFIRSMAWAFRSAGERRCRVPAMTREPPSPLPPPRAGLPNLVYKYPDSGKGEGVHFMRVEDPSDAVAIARRLDRRKGEPPGLFQPFVLSRLLSGRRIYDVRCELLVTPFGVKQVLAFQRESNRPLPERLENGLVESVGVFTSNLSTGGRITKVAEADRKEIEAAAAAVGEGLERVFRRGFRIGTGPLDPKRPEPAPQ